MATYIENDVQNTLTDICNGSALATAATRNRVPRNTLRGCLNSIRSYQNTHDNK